MLRLLFVRVPGSNLMLVLLEHTLLPAVNIQGKLCLEGYATQPYLYHETQLVAVADPNNLGHNH